MGAMSGSYCVGFSLNLVPQSLCWCNSERYHDPGVSFWMGKKSILALMSHGGQYVFSSPL